MPSGLRFRAEKLYNRLDWSLPLAAAFILIGIGGFLEACRRMVREINGLAMLQGARGSKPCDLEALAEAACLISHMVDELRDIAEVDLNPVFAWEKGLAVADARIVLQAR